MLYTVTLSSAVCKLYLNKTGRTTKRLHLPMHGTWVRPLVQEDVLEQLSLCATTTEARAPRACALQQEKPPQPEKACEKPRRSASKNKYIHGGKKDS